MFAFQPPSFCPFVSNSNEVLHFLEVTATSLQRSQQQRDNHEQRQHHQQQRQSPQSLSTALSSSSASLLWHNNNTDSDSTSKLPNSSFSSSPSEVFLLHVFPYVYWPLRARIEFAIALLRRAASLAWTLYYSQTPTTTTTTKPIPARDSETAAADTIVFRSIAECLSAVPLLFEHLDVPFSLRQRLQCLLLPYDAPSPSSSPISSSSSSPPPPQETSSNETKEWKPFFHRDDDDDDDDNDNDEEVRKWTEWLAHDMPQDLSKTTTTAADADVNGYVTCYVRFREVYCRELHRFLLRGEAAEQTRNGLSHATAAAVREEEEEKKRGKEGSPLLFLDRLVQTRDRGEPRQVAVHGRTTHDDEQKQNANNHINSHVLLMMRAVLQTSTAASASSVRVVAAGGGGTAAGTPWHSHSGGIDDDEAEDDEEADITDRSTIFLIADVAKVLLSEAHVSAWLLHPLVAWPRTLTRFVLDVVLPTLKRFGCRWGNGRSTGTNRRKHEKHNHPPTSNGSALASSSPMRREGCLHVIGEEENHHPQQLDPQQQSACWAEFVEILSAEMLLLSSSPTATAAMSVDDEVREQKDNDEDDDLPHWVPVVMREWMCELLRVVLDLASDLLVLSHSPSSGGGSEPTRRRIGHAMMSSCLSWRQYCIALAALPRPSLWLPEMLFPTTRWKPLPAADLTAGDHRRRGSVVMALWNEQLERRFPRSLSTDRGAAGGWSLFSVTSPAPFLSSLLNGCSMSSEGIEGGGCDDRSQEEAEDDNHLLQFFDVPKEDLGKTVVASAAPLFLQQDQSSCVVVDNSVGAVVVERPRTTTTSSAPFAPRLLIPLPVRLVLLELLQQQLQQQQQQQTGAQRNSFPPSSSPSLQSGVQGHTSFLSYLEAKQLSGSLYHCLSVATVEACRRLLLYGPTAINDALTKGADERGLPSLFLVSRPPRGADVTVGVDSGSGSSDAADEVQVVKSVVTALLEQLEDAETRLDTLALDMMTMPSSHHHHHHKPATSDTARSEAAQLETLFRQLLQNASQSQPRPDHGNNNNNNGLPQQHDHPKRDDGEEAPTTMSLTSLCDSFATAFLQNDDGIIRLGEGLRACHETLESLQGLLMDFVERMKTATESLNTVRAQTSTREGVLQRTSAVQRVLGDLLRRMVIPPEVVRMIVSTASADHYAEESDATTTFSEQFSVALELLLGILQHRVQPRRGGGRGGAASSPQQQQRHHTSEGSKEERGNDRHYYSSPPSAAAQAQHSALARPARRTLGGGRLSSASSFHTDDEDALLHDSPTTTAAAAMNRHPSASGVHGQVRLQLRHCKAFVRVAQLNDDLVVFSCLKIQRVVSHSFECLRRPRTNIAVQQENTIKPNQRYVHFVRKAMIALRHTVPLQQQQQPLLHHLPSTTTTSATAGATAGNEEAQQQQQQPHTVPFIHYRLVRAAWLKIRDDYATIMREVYYHKLDTYLMQLNLLESEDGGGVGAAAGGVGGGGNTSASGGLFSSLTATLAGSASSSSSSSVPKLTDTSGRVSSISFGLARLRVPQLFAGLFEDPIVPVIATAKQQRHSYLETMRSMQKILCDAVTREFLFTFEFFYGDKELYRRLFQPAVQRIVDYTYDIVLRHAENTTATTTTASPSNTAAGGTSPGGGGPDSRRRRRFANGLQLNCGNRDVVGLLSLTRLTLLYRIMMHQERRLRCLDGFYDSMLLMLWPAVRSALDAQMDSLRQSTSDALLAMMPARQSPEQILATVHPLTLRFAELSVALASLASPIHFDDANDPSSDFSHHHPHHQQQGAQSAPNHNKNTTTSRPLFAIDCASELIPDDEAESADQLAALRSNLEALRLEYLRCLTSLSVRLSVSAGAVPKQLSAAFLLNNLFHCVMMWSAAEPLATPLGHSSAANNHQSDGRSAQSRRRRSIVPFSLQRSSEFAALAELLVTVRAQLVEQLLEKEMHAVMRCVRQTLPPSLSPSSPVGGLTPMHNSSNNATTPAKVDPTLISQLEDWSRQYVEKWDSAMRQTVAQLHRIVPHPQNRADTLSLFCTQLLLYNTRHHAVVSSILPLVTSGRSVRSLIVTNQELLQVMREFSSEVNVVHDPQL